MQIFCANPMFGALALASSGPGIFCELHPHGALYSAIYRHYTVHFTDTTQYTKQYTETLMLGRLSLPVVVSVKFIALITTCFPLWVVWMMILIMTGRMMTMTMASKLLHTTVMLATWQQLPPAPDVTCHY